VPYDRLRDLPEPVQELSVELQQVWADAFNSAWESYSHLDDAERESVAFAIAWSAAYAAARGVKVCTCGHCDTPKGGSSEVDPDEGCFTAIEDSVTDPIVERKADPRGARIQSPIPRPSAGGGRRGGNRPGLPPGVAKPIPVNTRDIAKVLRGMTNAREGKLRRILFSTRNAEARALKYQEIRNALRTGELSEAALERFRQAYATMVVDEFGPHLQAAAQTGARAISTQGAALTGRSLVFQGTQARIDAWVARHGADLVVDITTQQRRALQVMTRALAQDNVGPRDGARYLRSVVGLTDRESLAVARLRSTLAAQGDVSPAQVVNRAEDYAGFLARRRADRIARTELSYAFNQGTLAVMREAVSAGTFSRVEKMWYTPDDERTCEFCSALHEQVVGIEETFPGVTKRVPNTLTPPAHPNCRCTIIYVTEAV